MFTFIQHSSLSKIDYRQNTKPLTAQVLFAVGSGRVIALAAFPLACRDCFLPLSAQIKKRRAAAGKDGI